MIALPTFKGFFTPPNTSNTPITISIINIAFANANAKTGYAGTGKSSTDYWNNYPNGTVALNGLKYTTTSGSTATASLSTNLNGTSGNSTGDTMYDVYFYVASQTGTLTFTNLPNGTYNFYFYSRRAADAYCSNITFNGSTKTTPTGPYWNNNQLATSGSFIEDIHYSVFRNVVVAGSMTATLNLVSGYSYINGVQIVKIG